MPFHKLILWVHSYVVVVTQQVREVHRRAGPPLRVRRLLRRRRQPPRFRPVPLLDRRGLRLRRGAHGGAAVAAPRGGRGGWGRVVAAILAAAAAPCASTAPPAYPPALRSIAGPCIAWLRGSADDYFDSVDDAVPVPATPCGRLPENLWGGWHVGVEAAQDCGSHNANLGPWWQ